MLNLGKEELDIVLRLLSRTHKRMRTPDTDKGVWDKMLIGKVIDKLEEARSLRAPDEFVRFDRGYCCDSILEVSEDIRHWLGDESGLPEDYPGMMHVTIDYREE